MKRLIIGTILCFFVNAITASSTTFVVINSKTYKPINNCTVVLTGLGQQPDIDLKTDSLGQIKIDLNTIHGEMVSIRIKHDGYLQKDFLKHKSEFKAIEKIKLRENGYSAIEISNVDSNFIGLRLKNICRKFNIDPGDYSVIHEPPHIARGICFHTEDGFFITFYIQKMVHFRNDREMLNQKIIGVGVLDQNCSNERFYGDGMPLFGMVCWCERD
jgi:hypothetical protein